MQTILHDLIIEAPAPKVFEGVTAPALLDQWWTKHCTGVPQLWERYELHFTPDCTWHATVTQYHPGRSFELTMADSDRDWEGTRVGFALEAVASGTKLRFSHSGWRDANEHFRVSCFCWATYLRVLKRYLEAGIRIPYEERDRA